MEEKLKLITVALMLMLPGSAIAQPASPVERCDGYISADFAKRFADDWAAAWNSHDMAKVLSHYTDDFEMSSPFISRQKWATRAGR